MISDETLLALVPPYPPPSLEVPGELEGGREMSEAARRVSAWASVLRVHLRRMIGENPYLRWTG